MRYKFRGKRLDNGEWVYGSLLNNVFVNLVKMKPVTYIVDPSQYEDYDSFEDMEHLAVEVDPETVGQFTGSKDKFGTEIYENHILKQTYHAQSGSVHDGSDEDYSGHHIGKVVITTSKGVCMKHPLNYSDNTDETFTTNQYKNVSGRRCEVIGDIHSNPELLEVKA